MAFSDLLRELKTLGCETYLAAGVDAHVLLTKGAFRAIVPTRDPGDPETTARVRTEPPALPYSVTLTPDDDGTVVVTFPDFPGATYGRTEAEALARAADFLADAVAIYASLGEPVPPPERQPQIRRVPPSDH